ncbi:MAG: hypothetical protein QNL61_02835 [Crocinitomicaceae bacterium]
MLIPSFSGASTINEYSKSELLSALFSRNIGSIVSLRAGLSTSNGIGAKSYQFDDKPEYRRANGTLIINTYPVNTKTLRRLIYCYS